ncbi:MAG: hydrogenase maturation protease [Chloroflexi bacterium]|nr:hydrogenase maturation protease [Chloroflexota bacterium]
MKPILVLGLGNPLQGDDGVGCRVAQELERVIASRPEQSVAESKEAAKQSPTRESEIASSQPFDSAAQNAAPLRVLLAMTRWQDVEVMDGGTPGVGLLNVIERRARVIIIDAAEMSIAPGAFRRFTPEQVALTGSAQRFSLHRSGVADALALARELKIELPEIIFFGVQPASVEWRDALSPAVQGAVPRVIEAILNELNQRMKSEG